MILRWGVLPRWLERAATIAWPSHLLVIGLRSLGDTIAGLPMLRAIRRSPTGTRVSWIAPSAYERLIRAAGADDFIAVDGAQPPRTDFSRFGAVIALADVAAEDFSHLGDLHRIPVRIGSAQGTLRALWCNHFVQPKRLGYPRHEARRNLRMLLPFGVDPDVPMPALVRDCAVEIPAVPLPADIPGRGYVVLHPYSAGHAREWPLAHWQALCNLLVAADRRVVLSGSPDESIRLGKEWPLERRPAAVVDSSGRLDLSQLGSLLAGADAVVAASTGPLHLAAAAGTPTIGLFVPRKGLSVDRWAPLGAHAVGMLAHARCPQGPSCEQSTCRCIRDLQPTAVAEAVETLQRNRPQQPIER